MSKKTAKANSAKNAFGRVILAHFGSHGRKPENWEQTLEFFGGKCAYCGVTKNIVKDHAIPANRKCLGTNQHGNFVPACKECNKKKRHKHYADYCDQEKLKRAKNKITKWMRICEYEPLTEKSVRAKRITQILDMAYDDLDKLANRYAELIELLK